MGAGTDDPELHVLRVFCASDGSWGNPLGVFLNGGAIDESHRQALAHELAVSRTALEDLLTVGRVDGLVIGVVELLLVHVEPHARSFLARLRLRLGRCDFRRHCGNTGRTPARSMRRVASS